MDNTYHEEYLIENCFGDKLLSPKQLPIDSPYTLIKTVLVYRKGNLVTIDNIQYTENIIGILSLAQKDDES